MLAAGRQAGDVGWKEARLLKLGVRWTVRGRGDALSGCMFSWDGSEGTYLQGAERPSRPRCKREGLQESHTGGAEERTEAVRTKSEGPSCAPRRRRRTTDGGLPVQQRVCMTLGWTWVKVSVPTKELVAALNNSDAEQERA
jgi:hypothetical protein